MFLPITSVALGSTLLLQPTSKSRAGCHMAPKSKHRGGLVTRPPAHHLALAVTTQEMRWTRPTFSCTFGNIRIPKCETRGRGIGTWRHPWEGHKTICFGLCPGIHPRNWWRSTHRGRDVVQPAAGYSTQEIKKNGNLQNCAKDHKKAQMRDRLPKT